jgi:hypothetical protein
LADASLGGDELGVTYPVKQRSQSHLVVDFQSGPSFTDVISDFLDNLPAPTFRETSQCGMEMKEITLDDVVTLVLGGHAASPSLRM